MNAAVEGGGPEGFFVEQENYPDGKMQMDGTELPLRGLQKVLKEIGK